MHPTMLDSHAKVASPVETRAYYDALRVSVGAVLHYTEVNRVLSKECTGSWVGVVWPKLDGCAVYLNGLHPG